MIALGVLWLLILVLVSIFPENQVPQAALLMVAAVGIVLWVAVARVRR